MSSPICAELWHDEGLENLNQGVIMPLTSQNDDEQFLSTMLEKLRISMPPIIARKELPKYLGGMISVGTLANMGRKDGPPYRRCSRNAVYERDSFLEWLKAWMEKTGKDC